MVLITQGSDFKVEPAAEASKGLRQRLLSQPYYVSDSINLGQTSNNWVLLSTQVMLTGTTSMEAPIQLPGPTPQIQAICSSYSPFFPGKFQGFCLCSSHSHSGHCSLSFYFSGHLRKTTHFLHLPPPYCPYVSNFWL